MVDYYVPVSISAKAYCPYSPGYRDQSFIFQPPPDDRPLNLSLNESRYSGPCAAPPAAVYEDGSSSSSSPGLSPGFQSGDELGNVFLVPDLEYGDVAQEEIVEAVEVQEEEEERIDFVINLEEKGGSSDEYEFAEVAARNAFLKSKHEELALKVAQIRELLNSEAKRDRRLDDEPGPALETEMVEVKSEGEMDSIDLSTLIPLKRSRNHSWPQMSTITSNQRKKEQNKLASKRFRERKKQELAKARQDISELEFRNDLLRTKADILHAEVENMKTILLDLDLIKIVDLPSGQSTIVKNN